MIDFSLTEEQQAMRDLAREFGQQEIAPRAAYHDQTGEFPIDIARKAFDIGLYNLHIPKECGGLGLGVVDACLIEEELSAACSGISTALGGTGLAQAPLIVAGTDEQKRAWLEPMTHELSIAAYCVTEPHAGSDVQAIHTTATRKGDDYIVNGSKMWITGAGHARWFFVLAYSDKEARTRGMTAFIIPRDAPGVEIGKKEPTMGQRASDTRAVTFAQVRVPRANRLGNEGEGWKIAMKAFDHTRPPVAAAAVGVARSAMDHAIRYAKERQTFGVPIAMHEAISFMIADMAKDIEAARLLAWQAAWTIDQGRRNTKLAAFAKAFAADTAMRVAIDAVQIFGGCGFSCEYPVEKLMRDAKIFQIYEGTSQIQRLIIAKEIFLRNA